VTEGRLILCQSEGELPLPLPNSSGPISLTESGGLRERRQAAWDACGAAGLSQERGHDMITAVSEAGMNCIVHVGVGVGEVMADAQRGMVQARVVDHGPGISLENLPNATLKKGFTTAGTLGHGMKMMLQTADRVFLLTNSAGTTVVVEQERVAPLPTW
jgi:anti-sigma regulatory factor (Ser/Thr protein kinase)